MLCYITAERYGVKMKKNSKLKKFLCSILSIAILFVSCIFSVSAENPSSIYEETHIQINMKNIEFEKSDNDITVKNTASNFISKYFAEQRKEDLNDILNDYPSIKNVISDMIGNNEEICAISYTEAPVEIYEDHIERIEKENTNLLSIIAKLFVPKVSAYEYVETNQTTIGANGNFALFTFVSKQDDGSVNTCTIAGWDKGSIFGGENYPAREYDYVFTTVPDTFTRTDHTFACTYSDRDGEEGKDFFIEDGHSQYIKIKVKDDPLGWNHLSLCVLGTYNSVKPYEGTRMVNSYYVHTWKAVSISVSVSASSDKAVSLQITPTSVDKSWQLYNYVSFNF